MTEKPQQERKQKLQKVLANRSLGSRRQMERWIAAGRVAVNGHVAEIGARVAAQDEIVVDGRRLAKALPAGCRVIVVNKRAGVIVSRHDPEGRPSVFDDLPRLRTGRWISVGRLDLMTSGLILLTNDGELAHLLAHPSTGIDREYAVRAAGLLEDDALARLRAGVEVKGRIESFSDIRYYNGSGSNHWYHVVLMEGRNHEVRDLFASQGLDVSRLKRVRYGPVVLPAWLPRGARQEMGVNDVGRLRSILGMAPETPARRLPPSRSMLIPYPRLPQFTETSRKPPRQ